MKTILSKAFSASSNVLLGSLSLLIVTCIWLSTSSLPNKTSYIISIIIMFGGISPFLISQKPANSKILTLSLIISTIAAIGRIIFSFLPHFKPLAAIIILSGVTLGPCAGFTVGATSVFSSNFFFGQGPWTPMQMVAFGSIGYLAGTIFSKRKLPRPIIYFYGIAATFFVYGGLINTLSFLFYYYKPSWQMFTAYYLASLPMDLIHSLSTFMFLLILTPKFCTTLEHIKTKHGIKKE